MVVCAQGLGVPEGEGTAGGGVGEGVIDLEVGIIAASRTAQTQASCFERGAQRGPTGRR